ncbi:helix-turn-helix domain-containing protein [Streptomyces sp. IBSBF 2507]|uniref:helix-turn-helix domain-containing protein n=1 Tax=Streptomyces sp. IBSBF 2507 TaxID=2903530 RepID=UPI00351E8F9C
MAVFGFSVRVVAVRVGRPGLALVELSVVEQRYRAVLAVLAGATVTEVAASLGVSRQTVSGWRSRYEASGLAGLADRSRRPASCPHQASARWRRRCVSCGASTRSGGRGGSRLCWSGPGLSHRCRRG